MLSAQVVVLGKDDLGYNRRSAVMTDRGTSYGKEARGRKGRARRVCGDLTCRALRRRLRNHPLDAKSRWSVQGVPCITILYVSRHVFSRYSTFFRACGGRSSSDFNEHRLEKPVFRPGFPWALFGFVRSSPLHATIHAKILKTLILFSWGVCCFIIGEICTYIRHRDSGSA